MSINVPPQNGNVSMGVAGVVGGQMFPLTDPFWAHPQGPMHTHTGVYPSTPQYDPPWSPNECGRVAIQKIENGYIVLFAKFVGAAKEQYYAETMKDVGDRITACLVKNMVQGETP